MSDGERVAVKPATEFDDGDCELLTADGTEIGVLQVEGEFYALQNQCLHDGGPVCTGRTHKKLVGEFTEPGKRIEKGFSDEDIISCPWHGWSYELETGEHLADDDLVLPTYSVSVEDGMVYVDL